MKMRVSFLVGWLALAIAATGMAQEQPSGGTFLDSLRRVVRLPRTTTEARTKGVPDSQVGGILDVLRRSKVSAGDAQDILQTEVEAREAGSPTENFGAYVQAQHRAGLRGRALADAIHAEQARRGMGRGHGKAKAGEGDRDDERDEGQPHGGQGRRPADTGHGHGRGRPAGGQP